MKDFICPHCGNSDINKIGFLNGIPYCRACIRFRYEVDIDHNVSPSDGTFKLSYELSHEQQTLSNKLIEAFKNKINSFVYAVCGSGKTEIVLGLIQYCFIHGLNVGFAVPRRDVAIELSDRFSSIFKENNIVLVYGGHTKNLLGDLIVLTTHQLYRYKNYFDLLIMDEVDAFPYKGDEVLLSFFNKSIKGNYVLMSATPSKDTLNKFKSEGGNVLTLFQRYHGHPLPSPKIIRAKGIFIYIKLMKRVGQFLKQKMPLFIFTPTIKECELTSLFLSLFFKNGTFVHSQCVDREERIQKFKSNKYSYLVTTAVLERGVTVSNLQVIVFKADSFIYDSYSLIQIAGRVGRKKEAPNGEVIFLVKTITNDVQEACNEINKINTNM